MKRLLLMLGPILSIAGSVGLIVFGRAVVGIFDGVLTYRLVNPPEPLPASLGDLGWVAVSGMALAFGLVMSCAATAIRDSQTAISLAGKILQVVAGLLLFFGAMPVLWSLLGAKRGFMTSATSAMTPKPDDVREMVQSAAPMLTVGSVILVVGAVALFVAGQVGFRMKAQQTSGTRSMLSNLAVIGSLVLGIVSSLLFVGIWLHGTELKTLLLPSTVCKPSELAEHLMGILNKSLLVFVAVGCQGILQAVAAIFAPTSGSEQTLAKSEQEA